MPLPVKLPTQVSDAHRGWTADSMLNISPEMCRTFGETARQS